MLPITDSDISYAEQILFGSTGVFDIERKTFIKELNTCDLKAVPGSGKTTVLLAKLLIIETRLPLDNNQSILVISHTNAAVDEIKNKIAAYCPKLFSAPHFIGTIQSFVDRFLAVPYYVHEFYKRPLRIDDDLYTERALRFSTRFFGGFTNAEQKNAKLYLNVYRNVATIRFNNTPSGFGLITGLGGNVLNIRKPKSTSANDWTAAEKEKVLEWLLFFKMNIMKDGYLCYDDAYCLADIYIEKFPSIINILHQRFGFVFVDEMQDMDQHQYDLLERIFTGPTTRPIFQRIGDKNQTIFSDRSGVSDIWQDRSLILQLNGSHRLTPHNARIVERLAFTPINVTGHKTNEDGTPIAILPHILVYKDSNITSVVGKFATLVEQYRTSGLIPTDSKHPYKAICWNTKEEVAKTRIKDFYPSFNKAHNRPLVNYDNLESYLYLFDVQSKSMRTVVKNLGNALTRVLRIEDVHDSSGSFFTKKSLYQFLKENHPLVYDTLSLKLYTWSRDILLNQQSSVLINIKSFIPQLLSSFGKTLYQAKAFVNDSFSHASTSAISTTPTNPNIFSANGFEVEVTTVHASKGQTHTATLYLESYYQKSVAGSGNYESERLCDFLLSNPRPATIQVFVKQSLRMAYVGFSRPTHFLCFAVHEDRYNAKLSGLNVAEWKVVSI